jgi:hypothetical protein
MSCFWQYRDMLEDVLTDPEAADAAAVNMPSLHHQQNVAASQLKAQQQQQAQGVKPCNVASLDDELHKCTQELEGLADLIHETTGVGRADQESEGTSSRFFDTGSEGPSDEGSWEEVQSSNEHLNTWGHGVVNRGPTSQELPAPAANCTQGERSSYWTAGDDRNAGGMEHLHGSVDVGGSEWRRAARGERGEQSEGSEGAQCVNLEEEELGAFMSSRGRVAGEIAETMSPMKAGLKGAQGAVLHAYSGRGGRVILG